MPSRDSASYSVNAMSVVTLQTDFIVLASVVQKVDSSIHRINHYPVDSAIGFPNNYPLDRDLSGG